ncbi:MAG: NAD-glutamate dehydrogenase [Candidatus Binatia bacterium]
MAVEARVMDRAAAGAQRLRAILGRRARGPEGLQLEMFAQALLGRGLGYVGTLAEEEQAALVWSAFRFFAAPGPDVRVRVLNPTYATEGWDSPVTVLETSMPDCPFIVDTMIEELTAPDIEVRTLLHPIFAARRDVAGGLAALAVPDGDERRESFLHVGLRRIVDEARLERLATDVRQRLQEVRLVTDDFPGMVARAQALAAEYDRLGRERAGAVGAEAASVADFLRWLVDGAFVFLGYREYQVQATGPGAGIQMRAGTGLGLLRREERSAFRAPTPLPQLPERVREWLRGPSLYSVGKTKAVAPVHRRAHMDEIGFKELDPQGRVVGERRFLGLFSSKAYAEEAAEVPLLRRMLRQVLAAERVVAGSHDHKEIVEIFNTMPKGVLFASTPAEVRSDIQTALAAEQVDDVVIAVRPGPDRLSVLIVMPEDRFSGEARLRILEALAADLGTVLLDEHLNVGLHGRARLQLVFAAGAEPPRGEQVEALCGTVRALLRSWDEGFREGLRARFGASESERLGIRWADAFPSDYRAGTPVERVLEDVAALEAALASGGLHVTLATEAEPAASVLRLYLVGARVALADFLPVLEHLGLRPISEDQVAVAPRDAARCFIQRFEIQDRRGNPVVPDDGGARLIDALLAVRAGRTEDDVLYALVAESGLTWRDVALLRTYVGYAAQAGLGPRGALLATLAAHPGPARHLFACFAQRFRPGGVDGDPRAEFLASLEQVTSLREDTLLRVLLEAIDATVRANFYAEPPAPHLAIKVRGDVSCLPRPRPLFEIHVHAPGMEGLHLRAGRVARGGIRWSDRPDDLRTEVLGLMKTQTVKNAVIVPTGAKGGFVVRARPGRVVDRAEVVAAYQTLIRGMLDLTDNLVGGRVVHPRGLVVHDGEDPYLVVAADKGTATFSDIANGIAIERGFWLGDAFASGGSQGYDHKALGITARGAWECVRTHFHEIGVDADHAPLSVVGIGDPSGDVFGNGLLRSPAVKLRAAFNHLHVFLDPEPDPDASFRERERLFRAGQGWDAYDRALLSAGGMLVARSAKRVTLTPESRAMLGLPDEPLSGEALVRAVLCLDADLLFNGGIGTYVKAGTETAADVGDPVNDGVRVDANALRARVVAEGGNLGFTARARVEYALAGGRINSDAVDNSAGVDMSDHEVNLKICLQPVVESGALDAAGRTALLAAVQEDVAARVLAHNHRQSRVLGVDQLRSRTRTDDFLDQMGALERGAGLDRALNALPDRETVRERRGSFVGFTRPELAVLMAHTKIQLQGALLVSSLPDDALLEPYLLEYFPPAVVARFPDAVRGHRLRREIVAAEAAGLLVDRMGLTFVHRVARDTGVDEASAVRAWAVAWTIADGERLVRALEAAGLATDVDTACQLALEALGERVTAWVIANADRSRPACDVARDLSAAVGRVLPGLPESLVGREAEAFRKRVAELEIAGLAGELAHALALAECLPAALDVVTVAGEIGIDPEEAGRRYHALGQVVDFGWVLARLGELGQENAWQRRAVQGLITDVLGARRRLVRVVGEPLPAALGPVQALLRDLGAAPRVELAALAVAVFEIRRLADVAAREG